MMILFLGFIRNNPVGQETFFARDGLTKLRVFLVSGHSFLRQKTLFLIMTLSMETTNMAKKVIEDPIFLNVLELLKKYDDLEILEKGLQLLTIMTRDRDTMDLLCSLEDITGVLRCIELKVNEHILDDAYREILNLLKHLHTVLEY
jgi:hypothetical protein